MGFFDKIGNWTGITRLIDNLVGDFNMSASETLQDMAEKTAEAAKRHIMAQDLAWVALSRRHIKYKKRKGYRSPIYQMTMTYYGAIGVYKGGSGKNTYMAAGVPEGVTNPDTGAELTDVSKWMEFGTRTMPARPLWAPSLREGMAAAAKRNKFKDSLWRRLKSRL